MIKHLQYQGQDLPLRISFYALAHCKEELGKDITESFEFENLEPLLFHSLVAGHKFEKKQMPFERDEVEFVLDECLSDFIKMIPEFFAEIKFKDMNPTDEVKKKE